MWFFVGFFCLGYFTEKVLVGLNKVIHENKTPRFEEKNTKPALSKIKSGVSTSPSQYLHDCSMGVNVYGSD